MEQRPGQITVKRLGLQAANFGNQFIVGTIPAARRKQYQAKGNYQRD